MDTAIMTATVAPRPEVAQTDIERAFEPGTSAYAFSHALKDYLLTRGGISAAGYAAWLADLADSARDGWFSYTSTNDACLAVPGGDA